MARSAFLPLPNERDAQHHRDTFVEAAGMPADDRIDFDAWLLPPEASDRIERVVHLCSAAVGPVMFAAALNVVLRWIV